MRINQKKTKVMVFNPCIVRDFTHEWELGGQGIEMVEEIRLLGQLHQSPGDPSELLHGLHLHLLVNIILEH